MCSVVFCGSLFDKAETAQTAVLNDEPDIKETTAESTGVSTHFRPILISAAKPSLIIAKRFPTNFGKTENGDIVNDALYKSMLVEERLNVNIDVVLKRTLYRIASGIHGQYNQIGSAGEDLYDFAT